jgi:hypothetical protein
LRFGDPPRLGKTSRISLVQDHNYRKGLGYYLVLTSNELAVRISECHYGIEHRGNHVGSYLSPLELLFRSLLDVTSVPSLFRLGRLGPYGT